MSKEMDLTALIAHLVGIDSVNPDLVPGAAGEAAAAAAIADWCERSGLETEIVEPLAGRPNVIARARGTGGGRTLLMCGHTDTVTVAGMDAPFSARIEGDRLHGRGAYDMKGGLAAALVACRAANELALAGDVVVAAVADEEHASIGVQAVLERIEADAAIVTEPTELSIAVAHKGFVWAEIDVPGRAAHGSRPHLGIDAIVAAGPILTRLGELDQRLSASEHPLLGRPSVHASTIDGGAELSSYPDRCRIRLERRTLPGETVTQIEGELKDLIAGTDATARVLLERLPMETDATDPIVRTLIDAGASPEVTGASYWADAAFIAAAGIPTVLYGPAGEGAHATTEWVDLPSCATVAATLTETARRFCA